MEAGYGGFIDVAASHLCEHKIKSKFYIKAKNTNKSKFYAIFKWCKIDNEENL